MEFGVSIIFSQGFLNGIHLPYPTLLKWYQESIHQNQDPEL